MMSGKLFERQHWPHVQAWASYTETVPPDELIQSVHLVAIDSAGRIPLCEDADGNIFLPGGTREPGEAVLACAAREVREEAGLELTGPPLWFGAHIADGYHSVPYRAHLPHPRKAWLWGVGPARMISAPTNPEGAEVVVDVRMVEPSEAKEALLRFGLWYPELLDRALDRHAAAQRRR